MIIEKEHSGIMVALMIPPEVAEGIAIEGGESAEDLHVTLAYLPGLAGDEEALVNIQEAITAIPEVLAPISGRIGGTGRFNGSGSSDGKDVFYASFNSPGLEALRRAVVSALDRRGLKVSNAHGYTPHITLKYLDPEEATPELRIGIPDFPIDRITIAENEEHTDMQMTGTIVLKGSKKKKLKKAQPGSSSVHVPVPGEEENKPLPLDQLVPPLDNLEAEVLKAVGYSNVAKYRAVPNPLNSPPGGKVPLAPPFTPRPKTAPDPDYTETEKEEDVPRGTSKALKIDLGSGQARESGHVGVDLYPYDEDTLVHDVNMGLPFEDNSASHVRMVNAHECLSDNPKAVLAEISRVLRPDGEFLYEGPNELNDVPPDLVLTNYESNEEHVDKEATHRHTFTKVRVDPATANDSEPRIGINQYDNLPADALLAMNALSYYWSDATTSGKANRELGYPSQGALLEKQVPKPKKPIDAGVDNSVGCSKESHQSFVFKADKMKQIVYAVVLSPDEVDEQDDWMTDEEIEKTAHDYMENSRAAKSRHSTKIDAVPVESYIAPQDLEFDEGPYGPQIVKKGSWVLAMKVLDPKEWQKVLDGDYQAFSVGGFGERT